MQRFSIYNTLQLIKIVIATRTASRQAPILKIRMVTNLNSANILKVFNFKLLYSNFLIAYYYINYNS